MAVLFSCITDGSYQKDLTDQNWGGMSFTPGADWTVSSLEFSLINASPVTGNMTARLYLADVNHKPTGSALATKTLSCDILTSCSFFTFTFANSVDLTSGIEYVAVIYGTNVHSSKLCSETPSMQADTIMLASTDAGSSWTAYPTYDGSFKVNGYLKGSFLPLLLNTFVGKLFGYDLRYREEWSTDLVDYDTGKEQVNQIWERPKRHWILPYKVILLEYRDKLLELCSRAKGIYNVFLFEDPYDYECALTECSITAVGGETTTQLIKSYYSGVGTWDENKTRIQPSSIFPPIVKIDAAVKTEGTHFTLNDDTGIIDWAAGSSPNGALSAGEVVTANYRFYFPVRKEDDDYNESTVYSGVLNVENIPIVEVIE